MRRFYFVLILLAPILLFGQNASTKSYTVTGKVIDVSTKEPLEFATIVFKNLSTDEIEFGGISNQRGTFSVKVSEGSYQVTVTFISYKSKSITISEISRDQDLGNILMDLDTEFLAEIEIVGEKRQLEIKPNKMVYNVAKDMSAATNMIADVLNNIPSVSVDANGNVSLMGQQNVAILIDNKVSSLTRSSGLSSIPASSIERIEVINNPGAAYKSSALGVINIILKKGKDQGLNASLTATSGYKDSHGALITFNHKSERVDVYTNTSYFLRNPVELAIFDNHYYSQGNIIGSLHESSINNNDGKGLYSTVGLGIQLTDKTRVSANFNYQNIKNDVTNTTTSELFDENQQITSSNNRKFLSDFQDEIVEFQLNFDQSFAKEGQKLSAYITRSEDTENYHNNIVNTNGEFTDNQYTEDNKIKNTIVDVQYSQPLNETSSFVLGYNGEYGKIPFRYAGNTTQNIDYERNVQAVFADFEKEYDKFYYSLGIRTEFSDTKLDYSMPVEGYSESRTDWFPSGYLEFTLTEKSSLNLSYGRKLIEPGYFQLNPVEQGYSETSSYKGNENLKPVFVDMSNMAFTYYGKGFTFTPSLFYNKYHDYWQEITYTTGEMVNNIPRMMTTPVNLGTVNYYGLNITAVNVLSNRVSLTSNVLLSYFDQNGIYQEMNRSGQAIMRDYNHNSMGGTLSMIAQFRFPKFVNIQTTLKHELPSEGAYSKREDFTYMSLSITKDLFNNNATLALTSNDLFNSNKTDRNRFDPNFKSKRLIEKEFRTILLSFTYRLNQSKKKRDIDFEKKVNNLRY